MAKGSDEELLMNNNSDSESEQPATTRRSTRKERGSGAHGMATLHGSAPLTGLSREMDLAFDDMYG